VLKGFVIHFLFGFTWDSKSEMENKIGLFKTFHLTYIIQILYLLYLFPFNSLTLCLTANDGGIQFAQTGLGWRRESDAAVFNGYIYQRLHNLWHSGKCHFWPMCSESHFTVWQHRLYRSEVHRQTNGALHLQGIVTVYINSNKSSVWNHNLL